MIDTDGVRGMMIDNKGCLTILAITALGCFALYAIGHTVLGWIT